MFNDKEEEYGPEVARKQGFRVQRASEGWKYGATNEEHVEALTRVVDFWNLYSKKKEWIIDYEWVEYYTHPFIKQMKLDRIGKDHFEHTPDLCFYEWIGDQPIPQLIIEIDGQSHDSKQRQLSDGYFKEWLQFKYKGMCKLIRIQKRELVGDLDLVEEELRNRLGEYLAKK